MECGLSIGTLCACSYAALNPVHVTCSIIADGRLRHIRLLYVRSTEVIEVYNLSY